MESDRSQQTSVYTEGGHSSSYRGEATNSSFQSQFTTDVASDSLTTDYGQTTSVKSSAVNSEKAKANIKLVPLKLKDLEALFQNIPQYQNKKPVKLNIRENDIDQVIEQQRNTNSEKSVSLAHSIAQPIEMSPVSISHLEDYVLQKRYKQKNVDKLNSTSFTEHTSYTAHTSNDDTRQSRVRPPFGADQPQQVYAMTNVQAYPMIGDEGGFRANKSERVVKPKSKRRKLKKLGSRSRKPRSRSFRSRTRSPRRVKSRGRSRRRSRKPKKVARLRSRQTPVKKKVIVRRRRRSPAYYTDQAFCTPYPVCDDGCAPIYATPIECNRPLLEEPMVRVRSTVLKYPQRVYSRSLVRKSKVQITCDCNLCQEKLQFIQPGVCSQKKDMWTNEYAIIPKPQINFIDPCKELDPSIYPRAERPCIRDGRGNPLTDCIGRPLRDPVGKKFLNFSANGSVLDTNVRGNFFTGQPPLCVKCPLPTSTCAPDTTHNWWMSCGYPVRANMGPFLNNVLAAEHINRRRY